MAFQRYKWKQQTRSLTGIDRNDKVSFQTNFDKFVHANYESHNEQALFMHAPPDVYASFALANPFVPFAQLEPERQADYLDKVAKNIADRFTAVGVLDRLDESLEVLHCRHPWIAAMNASSFPHSNPSRMNFPHR